MSGEKSLKEEIRRADGAQLLDSCGVRAPHIARVERRVRWASLWDATLDFGVPHSTRLQFLSRALSHHRRGNPPAPSVMLHH